MYYILIGLVCLIVGGAGAFLITYWLTRKGRKKTKDEAQEILAKAREQQKEILLQAKEEVVRLHSQVESEIREHRLELSSREKRLTKWEENLERKAENLDYREKTISVKDRELEVQKGELERLEQREIGELQKLSQLSLAEAKEILLQKVEEQIREDKARMLHRVDEELHQEKERRAQLILVQAMQHCATDVVSEAAITTVSLPSDELKGRLIGREGRNIRALEHATGVELIVDDTPEVVTLSSFDPLRREIARIALTKLIQDGRIHPTRIEEIVEKTKRELEEEMQKTGEEAAYKVGVHGLHPEITKILGRLKYRTSYGQNILGHSIEVALIAGGIASELGVNAQLMRRAGLLHDIGKAIDSEVSAPHATVGADIVSQYEKSPEVIRGIAEHHAEPENMSLPGFIIATADAISAARPGARRDTLENYLKRIEALEKVALSFPEVDKAYAIQAGREIRIMVKPDKIDDLGAKNLAQEVARRIEQTMQYPGQIKITVIRETRTVDYAK
jgi:ribonuclease Y